MPLSLQHDFNNYLFFYLSIYIYIQQYTTDIYLTKIIPPSYLHIPPPKHPGTSAAAGKPGSSPGTSSVQTPPGRPSPPRKKARQAFLRLSPKPRDYPAPSSSAIPSLSLRYPFAIPSLSLCYPFAIPSLFCRQDRRQARGKQIFFIIPIKKLMEYLFVWKNIRTFASR